MSELSELWPFVPGQQQLIFAFTGAAIIGLIALNVLSALRQRLPSRKVVSGLFTEISTTSPTEKYIRVVLLIFVVVGFLVLVMDTQVNGLQLLNREALTTQ